MSLRTPKRYWIFLVEGKTEKEAFEDLVKAEIAKYDSKIEVLFLLPFFSGSKNENNIPGGDITAFSKVTPTNISRKIDQFFFRPQQSLFRVERLEKKDIERVVHLVDTDGAFIPSEHIITMLEEDKTEGITKIYKNDTIEALEIDNIIRRNQRKAMNIQYLSQQATIKIKSKTYPYSIYYFSNNVDCFISGNHNEVGNNKVYQAMLFANQYRHLDNKLNFVFGGERSEYCSNMNYEDSWYYIQCGTNSLHRGTNFNLFFENLGDLCKCQ